MTKSSHRTRGWRWAALLAVLVPLAMPTVHRAVLGAERLGDATVAAVQATAGVSLGADSRAAIRAQVARESPLVTGVVRAVWAVLALVAAAAVLHAAVRVADPGVSTARVLDAAAAAAGAAAALRVLCWAVVVVSLGPDRAVAVDWQAVGRVDVGLLVDVDPGSVLGAALAAVSAFAAVGVVVGGAVLAGAAAPGASPGASPGAPSLGRGRALAAAAVWPVVTGVARAGLVAVLHVALR